MRFFEFSAWGYVKNNWAISDIYPGNRSSLSGMEIMFKKRSPKEGKLRCVKHESQKWSYSILVNRE
jgi:hypothetical protein